MVQSSTIESLVATLRADLAGRRPGDRLPATRELVQRHRVSPVTVSRAMAMLAADGLVVTRPGAGTYVAPPAGGTPPDSLDSSWQTVALGDRAIAPRPPQPSLHPPPPRALPP